MSEKGAGGFGTARSPAVAERSPRADDEPALHGVGEPQQTRVGAHGPLNGLPREAGTRRELSSGCPSRAALWKWFSGEAPAAGLPGCVPTLLAPPPPTPPSWAGRREASIMSFIDLWSVAWSWAISFAISCLNVA